MNIKELAEEYYDKIIFDVIDAENYLNSLINNLDCKGQEDEVERVKNKLIEAKSSIAHKKKKVIEELVENKLSLDEYCIEFNAVLHGLLIRDEHVNPNPLIMPYII